MRSIVFKPTRPAVTRFTIAALLLLALAACNVAGDSTKNRFIIFKPIELVAIGVYQGVDLSWDAVAGANSYSVYYHTDRFDSTSEGGVKSKKGITTTNASITDLTNGTTYHLRVEAINADGSILSTSRIVSATANLRASTKLSATGVYEGVDLSWGKVKGATSYSVYYHTASFDKTSDSGVKSKTGITTTYTSITDLTNGTTYHLRVEVINAEGDKKLSKEVTATATIQAPNLRAIGVDQGIDLSWDSITGADSYSIYYRTSSFKKITDNGVISQTVITATNTSITGLTNGTKYYLRAVTKYPTEYSHLSTKEVTATANLQAPTKLSATGVYQGVDLSWGKVKGATSYKVYYHTANDVSPSLGKNLGSKPVIGNSTTNTSITGLANGTKYYFIVFARKNNVKSKASSVVTATPNLSPPMGLQASGSYQSVDLSWDRVPGVDGYRVYYHTANDVSSSLGKNLGSKAVIGDSSTSITISGLNSGIIYYFIVFAYKSNVKSKASSVATGTTNLRSPTGLRASSGYQSVALSWHRGPRVDGYVVYYHTSNDVSPDNNLGSKVVRGNYTTITGLTNKQTYHFIVVAYIGSVQSRPSSATTATPNLDQPTNLNAIGVNQAVDLSWEEAKGATSYKAYYHTASFDSTTDSGVQNKTGITATNNRITGLLNGTKYFIRLVASNTRGDSELSDEVSAITKLAAQTKLRATGKIKAIDLSWSAVTGASYSIYYHTASFGKTSDSGVKSKTGITATNTIITDLTNDTKYYLRVEVIKNEGDKKLSEEASAFTKSLALQPSAAASIDSLAAVDLTWNALVDVTDYKIYYAKQSLDGLEGGYQSYTSVGGKVVDGIADTRTTIGGLSTGIAYYFVVAANYNNGEEAAAPEVTARSSYIAELAVGGYHSCVRSNTGILKCWGGNYKGQLGVGNKTNRDTATSVDLRAKRLSAGSAHSCAIDLNDRLYCWGLNNEHQLGLSDGDRNRYRPTLVTQAKLDKVSLVIAGNRSTCALADDINYCWGSKAYGMLGNDDSSGTSTMYAQEINKITANVKQFALGYGSGCAIDVGKKLWCWGNNKLGEVGDGTTTNRASPVKLTLKDRRTATMVAGNSAHYCAVDNAKKVQCWGNNYTGQLGIGSTAKSSNIPQYVLASTSKYNHLSNVSKVATGSYHSCALLNSRKVRCWGMSEDGVMGTPGRVYTPIADIEIPSINNAIDIASGWHHACVLLEDRANVKCWGLNNHGQLGRPFVASSYKPALVWSLLAVYPKPPPRSTPATPTNLQATGKNGAVDLSWGVASRAVRYTVYYSKAKFNSASGSGVRSANSVATTNTRITNLADGTTYYFRVIASNIRGYSAMSQIQSATTKLPAPHPSAAPSIRLAAVDLSWDAVAGVTNYKIYYAKQSLDKLKGGYKEYATVGGRVDSVSATNHTIGDLSADTTYYFVVVADYKGKEYAAPEVIADSSYIAELAVGGWHSCVRLNTGSIRCWGNNNHGQLGVGNTTNKNTATSVSGLRAKQLSAGLFDSCAIDLSDDLYCWGRNYYSALGLSGGDRSIPTLVSQANLASVSLISAGYHSTCALSAGNNYCWGDQSNGGLGNGVSGGSTPTAQVIKNITSDVKQFALGNGSGCAIDASGALWCWGSNWAGAVGDGTTTNRASPVKPPLQGSSEATMLAGGGFHYCVVDDDTKVQCWGWNKYGQLGIDSWTNSNSPQYVLASPSKSDHLSGVSKIAAGVRHSCALITGGKVRCWGDSNFGVIGTDGGGNRLVADTDMPDITNAIDIAAGYDHTCVLLRDKARVRCWGKNNDGQLGNGKTANSSTPVEVLDLTPLAAPTKLQATGKDKAIDLSWGAVKGATSYKVYYHTASFISTTGVSVKTVQSLSTSITGLTNGTKYYLRVEAINADGDKKLSAQVSAIANLEAPTKLQATGGNKTIDISWDAVTGATSYKVYYHTASFTITTGVSVKTVQSLSTSITGLTNGTKYYLRVEAINTNGDKKLSEQVSATPKLPAPTSVRATGGDKIVDISWDAVTGATSYKVYYHTASFTSTTGVSAKTVQSLSTSITGLTNGTKYYLRVEAINADGDKKLSEQVSATPKLPAPRPSAAPSIRLAAVDLSWDAIVGVSDYKIYYAKDSLDGLNGGYKNYASVGGRVESLAGTSHTIGDLSADTTYYFVVAANYNGEEKAAPQVSAKSSYIAELFVGGAHSCVRLNSGSIKCWGQNTSGQLGVGDKDPRKTATSVLNFRAKQLSTGSHSCAIDLNDSLYCWGSNGSYKLGLSDKRKARSRPTVTQANIGKVSLVSAGSTSTCAVADGKNYCWGSQYKGGLGDDVLGDSRNYSMTKTAKKIRIDHSVKKFALGGYSGCAIDVRGALWCWGSNEYGQVGDGTNINQSIPLELTLKDDRTATMLSDGANHYCVVDNANKVQCWGWNKKGQLGVGNTDDSNRPQYVLASASTSDHLTGVSKIAIGSYHSCAIIAGGEVRCWGWGKYGMIGTGDGMDRLTASADMPDINNAIDIAAGWRHTCVLLKDRVSVECWGLNNYGQLGNGTFTNSHTPVEVKGLTPLAAPTKLQATGKDKAIDISWGAVKGATSYKVYYHTASFTSTTGVSAKTVQSLSTSITGLTNGTKYYLRVEAINANGDKKLSAEVTATTNLEAPTKLQATGGDKIVDISWDAVTGATSYKVYYHTASFTSTTGVSAKTVQSLSTSITGLTNGTKYYLRVEAINTNGDKNLSEEVTATTNLEAPTNVIAIAGDKTLAISWDAVTGATSYEVYYHTASFSSTTGVLDKTTDTASISFTGLADGTEYFFRVIASNAKVSSALSQEAKATTKLPAPINLQASGKDKAIDLTWDSVTGATSYTVYYHTASFDYTSDVGVTSKTVNAPAINTSFTGLADGTTYYFRVIAINAKVSSALSQEAKATTTSTKPAPQPSAATSISRLAAVDLSWDSLASVTGYNIYYAKASLDKLNGGYKNYASVGGKVETTTDTSVTIGDLTADTTYYFVVAANYVGGNGKEAAAPELTANSSYIAELAMGGVHSCVRLNTGRIKCWGRNNEGQLGLGDKTNKNTATSVSNFRAKQLSAGVYHNCVIGLNDKFYCWGWNGYSQLGLSGGDISIPTLVTQANFASVSLVSAGYRSTCALAAGNNYCWGDQKLGGLGNGVGTSISISTAQKINNITPDVKQFAVSVNSGCAIDASNDFWCWGYNAYGQAGVGTVQSSYTSPVKPKLQGSSKATMLAGKYWHYCVVDDATKSQCWGWNGQGQLGINSKSDSNIPQHVLASDSTSDHLSGVSRVASGYSHSCALIQGGKVRCWGKNEFGKIGIDGGADRLVADTDMPGISNAIDIAVGAQFTCVLLDGKAKVKCWGKNNDGQLGNGTTSNSHTPVEVQGLKDIYQ